MVSVNVIWILLGTVLIFIMQAGFAMLETGFTRAKNAGNIMMKNLMDFCIGSVSFFVIGFGLMFAKGNGIIGAIDLIHSGDYSSILPAGVPLQAYIVFQMMFCCTSATICSGILAGRMKFSTYCILSVVITAFIYPVSGHWIWGGGWLQNIGFHDFSGSTAVHLLGGTIGFAAASILGSRIGKYDRDGKPVPIQGHSITLGMLGLFLLWTGWFGFNGCSIVNIADEGVAEIVADIFVNTSLSAACAAITSMLFTKFRYGKSDVSTTINGALAGLVSITAGCDQVSALGAMIIGAVAGIIVVLSIEFVDTVLKIDDPVGAVSAHGVCGAYGTIMVGLLSTKTGLFYGKGPEQFGIQCLGVIAVVIFGTAASAVIVYILKNTIGLRVTPEEEQAGLDISEHGIASAYPDFMSAATFTGFIPEKIDTDADKVPEGISEDIDCLPVADSTLTKVEIITKPQRFEALKKAMNDIGVTGMTVTQVAGFGMQKGVTEYYRGSETNVSLRPKIKVEIVIAKVPVEKVVNTAKRVLYTGHIGDGKIFVYDVKNVLRIRTGEYGYDAMQGVDE
ncbi:MAG: ammonium transporter [Lachnospira sp.]